MFLGRHPCAGMKIAKLEIKLVLTMMLLGYEYELVDGNGNYLKELPSQDRNNLLQVSTTHACISSRQELSVLIYFSCSCDISETRVI
jgi:hypothetical protein